MSDAVIIAVITGSVTIVLAVIAYFNLRMTLKIKEDQAKQTGVINEYHKEVNGRMGELLETTKALGAAEEKAEGEINGKLDKVLYKKPRAKKKK